MKTLANPPIIEALAQINYETSSPVEDSQIHGTKTGHANWNAEDVLQLQIGPSGINTNLFGVKLTDPTSKEVLQITKQFFAYSQTAKYTKWDNFRPAIQGHIDSFLTSFAVTNIDRIALRFINKFEVNGTISDLSRFLAIRPTFDSNLNSPPDSIVFQYTMPISQVEGRANVGFAIARAPEDKLSITLDIDVFISSRFKADSAELMNDFDKLREQKNLIFETCLTPELIKLFG